MSKRIFILGAGAFGSHLARRLAEMGADVVVADRNEEVIQEFSEKGYHALELDSDDVEALREAGAAEADAAVVAIGDNVQSSLLTTLSLRELEVPLIVARAADAQHAQALVRLGAHRVVLPLRDTAWSLAERLMEEGGNPNRVQIAADFQVATIPVTERLARDRQAWSRLLSAHGVRFLLAERFTAGKERRVWESEQDYLPIPGDRLHLAGRQENLDAFEKVANGSA